MRPPRIEPMIIMPSPPFSWLCSSSQQPSPSNREPKVFCSSLPSAWKPPELSEACACSCKTARCFCPQRRSNGVSMPMDSTTSALRKLLSAYCWAVKAWRLAWVSRGLLRRSLAQPTATCNSANTTADQPSTGLMRNSNTIITSAIGASISASNAGENRKSQTSRRSLSGCVLAPPPRCRRAAKMASKTRTRSWASS
ncbi:hypothetical protein D3C85_1317060 [compost metagenome]